MKVWLQHADFSEEEFEFDLANTLKKFADVDWPAELAAEAGLAQQGVESCPPGLGIVHPEGQILHICPHPSGAQVHFHYPQKVMGLFSRQKSLTLERVAPHQLERYIRAFFDQDWARISGSV